MSHRTRALLLGALAHTPSDVAEARIRVDARIAAYQGRHPKAFGAALRCLAEHRHPTDHDLDVITAGLLSYEAALGKGMVPRRAGEEAADAVGRENEGVIPGWWDRALEVYERVRGR